ncbi:MAG: T9SS type A sorting domain-containing protein [Bacteroidota bacterium]
MKKTFFIIGSLLISFSSFSQLSVRDNGYIFVSDQVLFVEDDINLNESDSKLYLRNEAQLIQGTGTTGNSGVGELSVYQTGNADVVTFNYWCSPVGIPIGPNGNSDIRVDLIDEATNVVTSGDPTGLISSIDAGFTNDYDGLTAPLRISNRWLYNYIASNQFSSWIPLNETTTFNTGLGFTMKGIDGVSNQLYDFRGKANNGNIENLVGVNMFTLIGNPYPSAIDAREFMHDPQNSSAITGVLYYWEQQPESHFFSSYIGGYATYTITNTEPPSETFAFATFAKYDSNGIPNFTPPGPGGTKRAERYIPVGQGFMIEGVADANVVLRNNHRVFEKIAPGNSQFFRILNESNNSADTNTANTNSSVAYNEYGLSIVPDGHKRFRLNVTFNDEFVRQLVHNFHSTATDGFDYGFEAKMSSTAPNEASWILDDVPYVIQANAFDTDLVIPVVVNAESDQAISFSLFDVQNFDESQSIYIHDMDNNIYVDLREQSYDINISAGQYDSRFEIVFVSETLNQDFEEFSNLNVFANNKISTITVQNPNLLDIKTVRLYDINGRLILNEAIKSVASTYNFSSESLSDGVYVDKIETRDNKSLSKKLILKNY